MEPFDQKGLAKNHDGKLLDPQDPVNARFRIYCCFTSMKFITYSYEIIDPGCGGGPCVYCASSRVHDNQSIRAHCCPPIDDIALDLSLVKVAAPRVRPFPRDLRQCVKKLCKYKQTTTSPMFGTKGFFNCTDKEIDAVAKIVV